MTERLHFTYNVRQNMLTIIYLKEAEVGSQGEATLHLYCIGGKRPRQDR